jgi:hypothetical protein
MFQTIADVVVLAAVAYLVYLYRSVIVPFFTKLFRREW